MVQVAKVKAADVGEIKEVKISGDNQDKWSPAWIKVRFVGRGAVAQLEFRSTQTISTADKATVAAEYKP